MKPLLSRSVQALATFQSLLGTLKGLEVAGMIKLPDSGALGWETMLEKALDGICTGNSTLRLVLMFDELPYMLQKFTVNASGTLHVQTTALTILDILRAKRMQHANLRMVFAGSMGLHHVLRDVRGSSIAAEPFNDMPSQPIGPLDRPDAVAFATHVLRIEAVSVADADAEDLAMAIADLTGSVPFYIERVVSRLAELDHRVTSTDAEQVVRRQLGDDADPWEMEHFRSRLGVYYPGTTEDANGDAVGNAKIAAAVLDDLALASEPRSIEEVWSAVKAVAALHDRAKIVQLLSSLTQDHYLECDDSKRYTFRFPLVRRWWVLAQGLQS